MPHDQATEPVDVSGEADDARAAAATAEILGTPASFGRAELITRLALMATGDATLSSIFDVAVEGVARVLGHEYCKVLELLPGGDAVKLLAGVGWKPGLVGVATVGTGHDSQAGYTLRAAEPVVVTDLRTEQRFWGPPLLRAHGVVSGMSAIIPGRTGPWGVLGVHSTRRQDYTADDPLFVEAVAALLGVAIARRNLEEEADRSRDQTVRALRREETRSAELRAIIAAMGDGVLVFDEGRRLLLMNQAAQMILGNRAVSSLADLAAIVGLVLDWPHDHSLVERPLAGSDRWLELSSFAVAALPIRAAATPESVHENRASTLVVIRDVTEARAAREAREAFVGMLSHELRTPITTVYGGAEILAREPDHPRRAEIANDVRAEADRLRRVVENLLVLSRVEQETLSIVCEPVSLAHLVPAIVDAEQAHWPAHAMRVSIAARVPTVAGDPTYIEQVLRNLLGNAAKFSPEGSPVDVSVAPTPSGASITVRDRGPGFRPDEADRLFQLFYRTDAARLAPGSGIGLFASRTLVELMNGRMSAESLAGGGAEFGFELPPYEADGPLDG